MIPADGSDPRDSFVGVDFTIEIRQPGVFNQVQLEDAVRNVISEFFEQRHIVTRHCGQAGLGSAGGEALIVFLNWVRENWEFLSGVTAATATAFYKIRNVVQRERSRVTNGFIDPYRPGIIVTLSPRSGEILDGLSEGEQAAFSNVLTMLPDLHADLAARVSTHDFSMRVIRCALGGSLNAFFKVKKTTKSDVAKMLKKIDALAARNSLAPTILLYSQFGLFRRFDVARRPQDLYRIVAR